MYFIYNNNYSNANTLRLELLKTNKKFKELIESVEFTEKLKNMSLESLMIEPIQRLPRY